VTGYAGAGSAGWFRCSISSGSGVAEAQAPPRMQPRDRLRRRYAEDPRAGFADSALSIAARQILAASTYPDQVVAAHKWLQENQSHMISGVAGECTALGPEHQVLVPVSASAKTMNDNLAWTSALGEAYYNQPDDVMAAVRRCEAAQWRREPSRVPLSRRSRPTCGGGSGSAEGGRPAQPKVEYKLRRSTKPGSFNQLNPTRCTSRIRPATAYGRPWHNLYTGTEMLATDFWRSGAECCGLLIARRRLGLRQDGGGLFTITTTSASNT
jgi:hypothetical protein